MQGGLSDVIIKNEIVPIQLVKPDVGVVSVTQSFARRDGCILKDHGIGEVTKVLVSEKSQWLIASAQNTIRQ